MEANYQGYYEIPFPLQFTTRPIVVVQPSGSEYMSSSTRLYVRDVNIKYFTMNVKTTIMHIEVGI